MPLFKFKKTNPTETIKLLIKNLNRSKFRIDIKLDNIEEQIKETILDNRTPSPALMQGWKVLNNMQRFVENQIAGFQNQLLMSELGNSLKDALNIKKIKDLESALRDLNIQMAGTQSIIEQFGEIQMDSMENMKNFNDEMDFNILAMSKYTSKINDEISKKIGNEFLKDLEQKDPGFFRSIPPEIKKKLI